MIYRDWHPMDTAPRDGRCVEIKDNSHGHVVARWWRAGEGYAYHWQKIVPASGILLPLDPTHWRELPKVGEEA